MTNRGPGRPPVKNKRKSRGVRLEPKVQLAMRRIAKGRKKSLSSAINDACRDYARAAGELS